MNTDKKRLFGILKFFIIFNVFLVPLYFFTNNSVFGLQLFTALLVYRMLLATGVEAILAGNMIKVPIPTGSFLGVIDWDCTGWKSILVFVALMAATPSGLKKKLSGLLYVPLIYFINVARIWFVLVFVHKNDVSFFPFLHQSLWSWGMIIIVLLVWMHWHTGLKNVAGNVKDAMQKLLIRGKSKIITASGKKSGLYGRNR